MSDARNKLPTAKADLTANRDCRF